MVFFLSNCIRFEVEISSFPNKILEESFTVQNSLTTVDGHKNLVNEAKTEWKTNKTYFFILHFYRNGTML